MDDRLRKLKWAGMCYLYCMKQYENGSGSQWLTTAEEYIRLIRDERRIESITIPHDYDNQMDEMDGYVFGTD